MVSPFALEDEDALQRRIDQGKLLSSEKGRKRKKGKKNEKEKKLWKRLNEEMDTKCRISMGRTR